MKKIYLSILSMSFVFVANAQVTLTKAFNEPVIGDVSYATEFDSVSVMPNTIGTNQTWDFSSLVSNTTPNVLTYTTVASTANGANYPTATFAEDDGGGTVTYYKATATQLELVGVVSPAFDLSFSNTAIAAVWPVSYGYSNSDTFSGSASSGTMTGNNSGNMNVSATGTGTLMLPDGVVLNNVLQVKTTQTANVSLMFGFVTATVVTTLYDYYEPTQKFPALSINYTDIQGALTSNFTVIKVNGNYVTGVKDLNNSIGLSVYPNPAKGFVSVALANKNNSEVSVEFYNNLGVLVKLENLGSDSNINSKVNIENLASGVYVVKTTVGDKTSTKKLIVQ